MPLRIGGFWVQTLHPRRARVYDLSDPSNMKEVSRITFDGKQKPHWIAADEGGRRIVMNPGQ